MVPNDAAVSAFRRSSVVMTEAYNMLPRWKRLELALGVELRIREFVGAAGGG